MNIWKVVGSTARVIVVDSSNNRERNRPLDAEFTQTFSLGSMSFVLKVDLILILSKVSY